MPIVDITPAGSSRLYDRPTKIVPIYLVIAEDPTNKSKFQKYIAVSLDDMQYAIKIIGIETTESENDISKRYQEILNNTDKVLYKEWMLGWHRIVKIQNLIYVKK